MYTELYHHGVKGQKWGVITWIKRRKARRKAERDKRHEKEANISKRKSEAKKKPHELSDEELDARIRRLQKERDLLDLETKISQLSPKKVSRGRKIIDEIIAPTAKDVSKTLLKEEALKLGKKYLGLNKEDTKSSFEELKKEVETLELKKKKQVAQDYFEKREKERREKEEREKQEKREKEEREKQEKKEKKEQEKKEKKEQEKKDKMFHDEVFGEGTNSHRQSGRNGNDDPIIDVEFTEVSEDSSVSQIIGSRQRLKGSAFIKQYFLEDKS